jgi:hypothetical protein
MYAVPYFSAGRTRSPLKMGDRPASAIFNIKTPQFGAESELVWA